MNKTLLKFKQKKSIQLANTLFILLRPIVKRFFDNRFNVQLIKNEAFGENEPYIIIGNHVTSEDPIIINSVSDKLIRFIASDTNYDNQLKKFLLNLFGSIPFAKRNFDIKAIKQLLNYLKDGYPVGVYPEGGRNWNGETDELIFSTAKLIKLAKVSVYTALCRGGYLSKPRWSQYYKKGIYELEITKTLTAQEVIEMSVDEIFEKIKASTNHNDYEWQRERMIPFDGKRRAENIERILYMCPSCEALNSIVSIENEFYCKHCHATHEIDKYGFIKGNAYDNVAQWDWWQKEKLATLCQNGEINLESQQIHMQKFYNNKKIFDGFVDITLDSEQLTLNGKGMIEKLRINQIKSFSVTLLDILEFYNDQNVKYRMILDPKKNISINLLYNSAMLIKRSIREYAK